MIGEIEFLGRLRKEMRPFRKESKTPYMQGILKGFDLSERVLKEVVAQRRIVRADPLGTARKWNSARFRHTIGSALKLLARGQKGLAVKILQSAYTHKAGSIWYQRIGNER